MAKSLKCSFCSRTYPSGKLLLKHLAETHGEVAVAELLGEDAGAALGMGEAATARPRSVGGAYP